MKRKFVLISGIFAIGLVALGVSQWFKIPEQTRVIMDRQQRKAQCPDWVTLSAQEANPLPRLFTVVSWNIYKTQNTGWQGMLTKLSKQADIIALQEARESTTQAFWKSQGWSATMLEAFSMGAKSVGVQIASKYPPKQVCGRRKHEPLILLPKSLLIGVYPLSENQGDLWVVSLHSINFSLKLNAYMSQLGEIADMLKKHHGPVIIAGDFNTWSKRRMAVLDQWMEQHQLQPVRFKNDLRSRFFGHALDHIYYRGIKLVRSRIFKTQASDHNALSATFRTIHSDE
ncbi:MAG: hypothetical protein CENE_00148 [Candidatus Celerinatantimonas neptuna]|nr:MAG: hypothetical protein CENE_00148 [Candidatus Celerinatantimonas neptuna]